MMNGCRDNTLHHRMDWTFVSCFGGWEVYRFSNEVFGIRFIILFTISACVLGMTLGLCRSFRLFSQWVRGQQAVDASIHFFFLDLFGTGAATDAEDDDNDDDHENSNNEAHENSH